MLIERVLDFHIDLEVHSRTVSNICSIRKRSPRGRGIDRVGAAIPCPIEAPAAVGRLKPVRQEANHVR
jgi:hypothetical protein